MLGASLDHLGQTGVEGISKSYVPNDTSLEEGERPDALGPIDDLIGDHEVHGLDVLLQRTDGREGNDAANADMAQGGNIGAVGDLMGRILVVQAVSRKEGNVGAVMGEDVDGRRGRAPGRVGGEHGNGLEAIELTEAGAANDGNVDGLCEGNQISTAVSRA